MRQLVVFIIFIGVSAAIECWREQRDSEKTTHTKDKTNVQCPGCDYCTIFVLTLAQSQNRHTEFRARQGERFGIVDVKSKTILELARTSIEFWRDGHETISFADPSTKLVSTLDWYCCAKNKCNSAGAARPKWALVLLAILSVFIGKFL